MYFSTVSNNLDTDGSSNVSTSPLISVLPHPPPVAPDTAVSSSGESKDKIIKKEESATYYVKYSFMFTYILLLTTATLTFIEAICTNIPSVRHALNLETCISLVAGYFYSIFLVQLNETEKRGNQIDYADVTKLRYVDWAITTPMMLFVLAIVLCQHSGAKIKLSTILIIIFLNYLMLSIGCLGEFGVLHSVFACLLGFVPFVIMFWIIYVNFVKPKYHLASYILFFVYLIIWSLYGAVYLLEDNLKNIIYNILDCIAKCVVGNFLFVYYSKMIVL
jgi:bacteriorhodopsin